MNKLARGFSLIEMLTVLAISVILLATTIPLGSHWIQNANLSTTYGEMSHGIGKAVSTALRNEQALNNTDPAAALCLSDTNEVSVLEATATELPNCALGTGRSIWTSSFSEKVAITENGNDVSCMCFNPRGLLTTNSCPPCTTQTVLDVTINDREEVLHVR